MAWFYHLITLLALLLCPLILSLPQDQMVLQPLEFVHASNVIAGDDMQPLFRQLANELDRGLPNGWERLMHPPQTKGTSKIEAIDPQYLSQAIDGWSLDVTIRSQAEKDVELLVKMHAHEAAYVAQTFRYNKPGCQGGPLPVCMFSLMVVVRQVVTSEQTSVKLGHLYVEAFSNAIQQMYPVEECHFCWFRQCCHTRYYPRDLSVEELGQIETVLSTKQAYWAYEHFPEAPVDILATLPEAPVQMNALSVQELLRQFVKNKKENADVFKKYNDTLVGAIQDTAISSRRNARSVRASLKEEDLISLLDSLLSPCFLKAQANETAQELWRRVYGTHRDIPLSLECETIHQRREVENPPTDGCNKSTIVTTDTKYSWLLTFPRDDVDLIDVVFISNDVEVKHLECESLLEHPDDPSRRPLHCFDRDDTSSESDGSNIRWSVLHPGGSFFPIRYLVRWRQYPNHINKAVMDILRYSSATAYLRIPLPQVAASVELQGLVPTDPEIGAYVLDPALLSLGSKILDFAKVWPSIANALKPTITQTVTRKVCLGFEAYGHTVKALHGNGIDQENLAEVIDIVLDIADVPDKESLRKVMPIVKFTSNFTWTGETASYTSTKGTHSFFYFLKHANEITRKIDIAFGMVNANFTLAPDVLIVTEKKSSFFGLSKSETVYYRNVPHVVTLNDTVLLGMYFEMMPYRKLAVVTGLQVPDYPNLDFLCDLRS